MRKPARRSTGRVHAAWIVLGVVFLVLLGAAGTRAAPGVLMLPIERELHWSRATISLAISVNLALYGLTGPFAAAAMQRFGVRRTLLVALATLGFGVFASAAMTAPWQMVLIWGVVVGCATGVAALSLSATIVNRWFVARRGLAMGLLTASTATGQLVFLPMLAAVAGHYGWRTAACIVGAGVLLVWPLVLWRLPERPESVGTQAYGASPGASASTTGGGNPVAAAFAALASASRTRDFWLLAFSFFVCGASTNGYIGSHFIAMCADHGIAEVGGAGLLAGMGLLDLVGTTASGWLSDRFDSRKLLFWYYGLRGLSLIYLPYAFGFDFFGLPVFALFYGLDWIATVPPTVRLANDVYGSKTAPIVFGWIVAAHQLGAACATLVGGLMRASLGTYTQASMLSGGLCVIAAVVVLRIARRPGRAVFGAATL
jgi:predicted MFS family arabinose efflux permease